MKTLLLQNASSQKITAHLFEPAANQQKLVVINSATGVKQQLYFNIATFLAESGFTVITYDYSGIGLSKPAELKQCKSSMRSWGAEDFAAVTDYIKHHYKNYQKFLLGHSVGALILGMNKDAMLFERFVFISTQNATARHLKFKIKLLAYVGFGLLVPLTTKIFGYFPAYRFGLGASLPAGVAKDWRTLILNPTSTNALLDQTGFRRAQTLAQKALVLYADDDEWLTENGVRSLLKDTYPLLQPTFKILQSKNSPNGEIGHINFFRSYNRSLWSIISEEFKK